jgi:glycogen synthase
MKILMTADAVGGVWTYALELGGALREAGQEVVIATMGPPPSAAQRTAAHATKLTVVESRFALEWMTDPWADLDRAGAWLLELEAEFQPDVVHLNQFAPGALPWKTPSLVVGHSCVLSWWRAVHGTDAPAHWSRYRDVVRTAIAGATMVATPSAAMMSALHAHYGVGARAIVVHNGRDPRRYRPGRKQPLVLTAGRLWDEAKNAAAVARVARHLPWRVVVAGEQRRPDGDSISLEGVRLLGQLSEAALADWYASAAIYALPARYEPFGLTALEAALSGCALVLGDIPSLREVWGNTAIFVAPGDDDRLHDAIACLIADEALRTRMAERARRRALRFTPRRMAACYRAAYASILDAAPSGREAACA